MELVIILIALGLERYVKVGSMLARQSLYNAYLSIVSSLASSPKLRQGYLGLAFFALPLIIVVWLVLWLFCALEYWVIYEVLGLVVLLYCLGPVDLYHQFKAFLDASKGEDKAEQKAKLALILGSKVPQKNSTALRALTSALFFLANRRVFAVLFWFVLLGPVAALLYRLLSEIEQYSLHEQSHTPDLIPAARQSLDILDFLPIRLMVLIFALAGNFTATFSYWMKNLWRLSNNHSLLTDGGLIAIGADTDKDDAASLDENKLAFELIDRSTLVFVAVIAVFSMGAWIY